MNKLFYNMKIEEIFKELNTNINGLSSKEAKDRLIQNGENKLKEKKEKSNLLIFLGEFNDLLIILLIFAAIFSFIVSYIQNESYIESIIIIVIVIINAILSYIQEKKASEAIEELNKMFVTNTSVIRDGVKEIIDVKDVVVGDIIELEAGDYVSSDARIIKADNLEVNEATLTGESLNIKKNSDDIYEKKELFERTNMVYSGCNVTNGHAFVVVCATGMNTELGKIASSLTEKKKELTPLQKKVNEVSKVLTYIILVIIIIMFIIGLIKEYDFFDILMLSISLAVAAIPEGLSSIITIILSLGMSDMAKKNVIIRKMASVETLGSTDVICSDKTGTITQNKMTVKKIYVNDILYNIDVSIDNMEMLGNAAYFCHNVSKNEKKYMGDETEVAIYKYLEDINFIPKGECKRIKEIPFDSERKMMSTINEIDKKTYSFTKGSLDSVINNCDSYLLNGKLYPVDKEFIEKVYKIEKEEASLALRNLAFAYKDTNLDSPEENMIFLGMIGLMDPPRDEVKTAILTCKKAGIKPVMITGDSLNTAIAIAKEVGIIDNPDKAILGSAIDKMSDKELEAAVNYYEVYARISPNAKLRIVEALQKNGNVVAMTGDGVNDAPAIKCADIGIGMGITGTEVVKNVADCILVDDSFATIVDGVEEGRRITSNIKKTILYLLAGNLIEVILVFMSMILNVEMFSTLQLLWINLVTDSIPAIMLAFEEATDDVMENSPANRYNASFFTPFLISKLVGGAIIKSVVMIILYFYLIKTVDVFTASSLLFIFLIMHELLYSFTCRDLKKSVLNKHIFANKRLTIGIFILLIIQIVMLTTDISKLFIVQNIKISSLILTMVVCFLLFIFEELTKPIYVKLFKDYKESKK